MVSLSVIFTVKPTEVIAVVESNHRCHYFWKYTRNTKIAYKIINFTDHLTADFQEFKDSTTHRTNEIERPTLHNVTENETATIKDMK